MVDEKYYLSDRMVETFLRKNKITNNHFPFYVTGKDGPAKTVMARQSMGASDMYIQDDMTDKIEYIGNLHPPRNGRETQEGKVYGAEGVSPALLATDYKGKQPKIITDNMQDKQVMEIGNIYPATGNPQAGRVYDGQGISPTLDTMEGGNRQPKILTPRRTEYGKQVRKEYENGNLQESRHNMTELTPRGDDCSNTLTSVQKDNLLLITEEEGRRQALSETRRLTDGKRNGKHITVTMTERGNILARVETQQGQAHVMTENAISNEANEAYSVMAGSRVKVYGRSTKYRIRRLTERECFRLMDVEEKDIDAIQAAGISGTQQYKLAGNSIVVACLYHLFRKLFVEKENENEQLTLW